MESYNRVRKVAGLWVLETVIDDKNDMEATVMIAKFSCHFFNEFKVESIARQLGFPVTVVSTFDENPSKFSIPPQ